MRLFIATHFPAEVLADLNDRVSRLKPRLPPASWVRPETQHLTFAFLGEQPESRIADLIPPLTQQVATVGRFDASLRGCGFFPNARHARVGWVGLTPEQPFIDVARLVRDTVTAQGVALDGSDFKPHLTLMRLREGWPPASIELFSRTLREFASRSFPVEGLTLFTSQLNPQGAVHTAVHHFPLA